MRLPVRRAAVFTSAGAVLDVLKYSHETMIGHSAATLTTIVDVTERKRAEEYVTFLALHDPLTGVANRTLFTRELTRLAIVRTIIGLAHSLGMTTTAEGVETRRQLEMLKEEGWRDVQGYLLSRPVPACETAALIARRDSNWRPPVELPAA